MVHFSAQLLGLAVNPALPPDLLERLITIADDELCVLLADREDVSPEQSRALAVRGGAVVATSLIHRGRLGFDDVDVSDPEVALTLLDEGLAPETFAHTLLASVDPSVRAGLAECAHVPEDVVAALAADADQRVVVAVAHWARLTHEVAQRLVAHPHMKVRQAVAGNHTTPAGLLAELACGSARLPALYCEGCDGTAEPWPRPSCDGSHEQAAIGLLCAVAANPSTPASALSALVEHPAMGVRWALAQRQDLTEHDYRRLAEDSVPGVCGDVAENPAISEDLMRTMAGNLQYDVRRRLAHNPGIPLEVLAAIAPVTRIGATLLPRIANATAEEVELLASSPVAAMRMLVAERPDLPRDVVGLLAEDRDAKVLKSLARNPVLTEDQLRAMVSRHGSRVSSFVVRNPRCSTGLLQEIVREAPPGSKLLRWVAARQDVSAETLVLCLGDRRARPVAAGHPALPPDVITELLRDDDWHVAHAAAANPSLPRQTMESLLPSSL